jgi:hypothetical protein
MPNLFTRQNLLFCLFVILYAFPRVLFAQKETFSCGTDAVTSKKLTTDSLYRAFIERVKPATDKAIVDTTTLITIPVVFVVYHLGEPVGAGSNVSVADLQNQIGLMNKMFAGTKPTYGGVDTRIRFTLARRTNSCEPFNGIARVDARSVSGYENSGLDWNDWQRANQLRLLIPEYRYSGAERFVVVRVVHSTTGAGAWANYGGDIILSASIMKDPYQYNSTLTHEMGHVLFLSHTFDGTPYDTGTGLYGCPPNNDPLSDGDRVEDTDPHKPYEPNNSCLTSSEAEINSCTGRPFGLIGRNFMSYGCNLMLFTAGQRFRMRSYLADGLRTLTTSIYGIAPDSEQPLTSMVCSVSAGGTPANYGFGIKEVQFQGIRKSSKSWIANDGFYQDYSCQERTIVTAGQSYSLLISGSGTFRRVYIDYNNDGAFQEATELAWASESNLNPLITIPATATTDRYLRMRIIVDTGNSPPSACYLPGSSQYGPGEVEDYAVRILPADTSPSVSLGPLAFPYLCRTQQLPIPIITQGSFPVDNIFRVQLSDATGSFENAVLIGSGTRSPISVTLPANSILSEDYRMRVLASNPALTSESSPVLAIEDPASITITPGSMTLTSGQSASITLSLAGRLPIAFTFQQNGTAWWSFDGLDRRTYVHTFVPTGPAIYTINNVRNACGTGSASGSFTVVTPCTIPTNLTETQQTTYGFRANWSSGGGQSSTLQWKEAGTTTWNQQTVQGNPNWFISNLTFNKTYVWRVKTSCLNGESDWSAERTISLTCPVPFQLYEVLGQTSTHLRWWYSGSGVTYTIQWRPSNTVTWNTVAVAEGSIYQLTGLTRNSAYEWRIRANCPGGSLGDYSTTRFFTTQCGPPEETGYSTYSTSEIAVSWSALPGVRYQVRYRATGSAIWIESDTSTSLSYARFRNLTVNTSYEYQVRSICSLSEVSAYSNSYNFTAQCSQPYVYLSTISLSSAQINWSTLSGQRYDLRWRAVGAATWTDVQSLTTSSYQFTNLTTGTTYEVQMRGVCSGTILTAYTSSLTFTPSCPVPVSNSMWVSRRGLTSADVVYTVEQGVSYLLQWRVSGTATWQSSATFVAPSTNTNYTSSITSLSANTTYEWRVLSFCSGGATGTSAIVQFQTGCFTPYSNGVSVSATSVWVYVSGTTSPVQVRWRPIGTATWTESNTITGTSYQIMGLTVDVTYEWQVRALCSSTESSAYSSSNQFTTRCATPSASSLYTSNVLARSAVLNWSSSTGIPTDLRWRPVGNPDWTTVASLTTSSYSLTGLTTGTTYEWQIRSVCSASVTSNYVAGPSFTLTCPLATSLAEEFISPKAAQFRWIAGGGQSYTVQWRVLGETTWPNSATYIPAYSGTYYSSLVNNLTSGATYEWQVVTNCDGTPTASASRTFIAECTVPKAISYYNLSSRAATVYWNGYSGLSGLVYRVRWRAVGTTTWTESTTTVNASFVLTNLTNATTYEWQVQSICGGTPTNYSPNGPNFTTSCPTPSMYGTTVSDVGARLNFSYLPGEEMSLRYRVAGSATWTTINSLTTSSYFLGELTPTTAYEWQIVVNCQGGQNTVSSVGLFTTLAGCDPNEPNNTPPMATNIPANATSYSTAALCLSVPTDNDWFRWELNGQVYYILVHPFAYNTTGLYSLTIGFVNNVIQLNTRAVNGAATDTHLRLYAANGTTELAQNDDANGTVLSEIRYTIPASCTAMTTVKPGSWTDPSVWSCNRVPTNTDAVQVLHEVSMPASTTGNAGRVTYGAGGKLMMNIGARLMIGQ